MTNEYTHRELERPYDPKEPGDWWAVAQDIAKALDFRDANMATRKMPDKYKGTHKVRITSGKAKAPVTQDMIILNEKGLYRLIMRSNKPEAEAFQDWVFETLKTLRQATGLEGFQIFRMLDKEHQREAMGRLRAGLTEPVRVDFIKANTVANKAVSSIHGYPKMIKKGDMAPDMLIHRQKILDETVNLMSANDSFGLGLSVSQAVYGKYHC
ncbi:MAG: Bro-N domain-containing protein [Desulfitobacterium hafniense]|nr:Bro-N domain-containing protein [Desulfitobacterium hafniense]